MKPKSAWKKWILFSVLLIPAVYLGVQMYTVLHRSYVTQAAVRDTLSDSIVCSGIVGTEQTEVTFDGNGLVGYLAANAERVAAGEQLAVVLPDLSSAQQGASVTLLEQEIAVLQKAQGAAQSSDAEILLRQIYASIYDTLDVADSNDFLSLPYAKNALQLSSLKMLAATNQTQDLSGRIVALTAQRDAAVQAGTGTIVTAPVTGYFVSGQDSRKHQYNIAQLQEMPFAEFSAAAQAPSPANDSTVIGKIVQDYKWRFFALVTKKQAEKFERQGSVTIAFPDFSEEEIPAQMVSISVDEESQMAKVELASDYLSANVIMQEQASARITFSDYTGLRIDKRALRIVDGKNGVYIKYGNVIYFRPITILFENEDYMLVPQEQTDGENEVQMFDEVIVSGTNLSDGKTL